MAIDFEVIQKVIRMVEESDITGLAVEEGGVRIEVRREKGGVVVQQSSAPSGPAHSGAPTAGEVLPPNVVPVISPMVGTFYRSSSPDAKAFVDVGDHVEKGKAVCIIEAMKLFNQIEAEVSGKVIKFLVENGKPVEYGQKLMLIEKEG